MADLAVRVRGLGKRYHIGIGPRAGSLYDRVADLLRGRDGPPATEEVMWALRDVDVDVERGTVLGVLGRNGSGKTTLMKILARVTAPTEGRAEVHGRVGALLQVGAGFHPELTGRDNIHLSGTILGMTRSEVAAAFDGIVDFAEIEAFLDTPVKHYSSGMFMRLGFSVAAHLANEVLLVDEVLAVGDAAFQQKCRRRIRELVTDGRTALFVTHSMDTVPSLCDAAIVLDGGRVRYAGSAPGAVESYRRLLGIEPQTAPVRQGHVGVGGEAAVH